MLESPLKTIFKLNIEPTFKRNPVNTKNRLQSLKNVFDIQNSVYAFANFLFCSWIFMSILGRLMQSLKLGVRNKKKLMKWTTFDLCPLRLSSKGCVFRQVTTLLSRGRSNVLCITFLIDYPLEWTEKTMTWITNLTRLIPMLKTLISCCTSSFYLREIKNFSKFSCRFLHRNYFFPIWVIVVLMY